MTEIEHLPSDRALLAATRDGSDAAWSELCARHLRALDAMARADGRGARRDVERALGALRDELTGTSEVPSPPAPAIRAVRPLAISLITGGSYGPTVLRRDDTSSGESTPAQPRGADADALDDLAVAFAHLPDRWQTVLWHRLVEDAPAATVATLLGCTAADVGQIEQIARRGLFDDYIRTVLAGPSFLDPMCRSVLPLLGAYRRGTLPAAQDHRVTAHVTGYVAPTAAGPNRPSAPPPANDAATPTGCAACQRRLGVPDRFAELVPMAIVPGLTGLDAARARRVVGAGAAALGVSAVAARRSDRSSRFARAAGVAAVVLAVLAAAFFIRTPFGDLDADYADLLDRASVTTSTVLDGSSRPIPRPTLANRIELAFPGARQGAVYVPGGRALSIAMSLSTPAPVFAGATGTIDVALTNDDSEDVSFRFAILTSPGVTFDELSEGDATCGAGADGATCDVRLDAGGSATLSLLFSFDVDVSDRLVVASNFAPEPLDVPVEFVPDLVVGRVGRSDLHVIGGMLPSCAGSPCRGDAGEASSTLDIGADQTIERALLVWEGEAGSSGAGGLRLSGPGMPDAVDVMPATDERSALVASRDPAPRFRSVTDVTALVSAAGPGAYTVRPLTTPSDATLGSWRLLVEVAAPSAPRRLVVALASAAGGSGGSITVDLPISGSAEPQTVQRPATLALQGADERVRPPRVSVGVLDLVIEPMAGSGGDGNVGTYHVEIPSASETVSIEAFPIPGSARLGSIGLVIDVVS